MKKFYITTPLYYVNANPHIGHAYTTILADVISRFHKLLGEEVYFLTGTDEHGQKVFEAARNDNKDPIEHCDYYSSRFRDLWEKLGIEYDDFIRTTEPRHKRVVAYILQKLYDEDKIYASNYEGWYCVPCERFWTEKDLIDGNCPDCNRETKKISEKNYFFRMSEYQDWLIEHIENNEDFIKPRSRKNEILGFLRQPLNDLCISRPKSRLEWGIPLPFDPDYVTYVWFDALLNYISAPGYHFENDDFEKCWPADLQLMAKDIITTHAVYWPTMLKAAGIEPPKTVFAHGWWMVEDSKMGKSLGNAVDPHYLVDTFGRDQFRYFLMRGMVLGQDSQYNIDRMIETINTELANNLGNISSRLIKMLCSYFDSKIPAPGKEEHNDTELKERAEIVAKTAIENIKNMKIDKALYEINILMNAVNSYLEANAPWKLAKDETKRERLASILYNSTETLRIASILLYPVMPDMMAKILENLGEETPPKFENTAWGMLQPDTEIEKLPVLFPRIDAKQLEKAAKDKHKKEMAQKAKTEAAKKSELEGVKIITYDDFAKLQLKVAEVKEAVKAENADKLLLLKIDVGEEKPRDLVAGIAKWYTPEELIGKKIIIIANLKPAKIRGHVSQGMLLAADHGDDVVVLTLDRDLPPGSSIR